MRDLGILDEMSIDHFIISTYGNQFVLIFMVGEREETLAVKLF